MRDESTIATSPAGSTRCSWRDDLLPVLPVVMALCPLFYIQLPQDAFLMAHSLVEMISMVLAVYAGYRAARLHGAGRPAVFLSLAVAVFSVCALAMAHLWFLAWADGTATQADIAKAVYLWSGSRVGYACLLIGMPLLQSGRSVSRWICRGFGVLLPVATLLLFMFVFSAPDVLSELQLPLSRAQKLRAACEYAFAAVGLLAANVFLRQARQGYECPWSLAVLLLSALCEWWLALMFGANSVSFPLACAGSTAGFILAYFALFVPREREVAGYQTPENSGQLGDRVSTGNRPQAAIGDARILLDAGIDPIFFVDMRGRIIDAGRAAEDATGRSLRELSGKPLPSCFCDPAQVTGALQQAFRDGEVRDRPCTILHRTGRKTEVICSMTLCRERAGMPQGVLIMARDITELRQYETQLLFQATCDALTALPNRLVFRERLARAMAEVDRKGGAVGVVFIDIDNFKDVNETLGHAAGDDLLKTIAMHLNEELLPGYTVARMGGDEFAVLIEHAADGQAAEDLAHLIRRAVGRPRMLDQHEVAVTCSVGITLYPKDGKDVECLLRNADTAMYKAKEEGKNCCSQFTAEMNDRIYRRVEIGNCLRHALKSSELSLHYQPRVSLAEGEIVGMEALLRWQSAELGPVSPGEFIPIAEGSGLIVPIGEWVLRKACMQARQWQRQTGKQVNVAVNLSARQFRDVDVVRTIDAALAQSGLSPGLLEIELTESMLMHDVKRVAHTLAALKEVGIRIAVDDFGTGYSSLNYLKTFPLDFLKIDRSFINDITHDVNDEAIVRAMIAMSHSLGIKVIAEGVETREQLAFLLDQGCDEIQGYYFSKPLPENEAMASIVESRHLNCLDRLQE
jgi:diguanylate cyclase (GGDEF)-like protein/PAS domain S-box-containing protein